MSLPGLRIFLYAVVLFCYHACCIHVTLPPSLHTGSSPEEFAPNLLYYRDNQHIIGLQLISHIF